MNETAAYIGAGVIGMLLGLTIRYARRSTDPVARGFALTIGGCGAVLAVGAAAVAVLVLATR